MGNKSRFGSADQLLADGAAYARAFGYGTTVMVQVPRKMTVGGVSWLFLRWQIDGEPVDPPPGGVESAYVRYTLLLKNDTTIVPIYEAP